MTRADSLKILKAAGCTPREAAVVLSRDESVIFPVDDGVADYSEDEFREAVEASRR